MKSGAPRIRKRSVVIAGHATSVSLEEAFWRALKKIAQGRRQSLNALISEIDCERPSDLSGDLSGNLSSAIRVFVLENSGENSGSE
jgi:predicted DNA-binding ribbon-helix-helix protein